MYDVLDVLDLFIRHDNAIDECFKMFTKIDLIDNIQNDKLTFLTLKQFQHEIARCSLMVADDCFPVYYHLKHGKII